MPTTLGSTITVRVQWFAQLRDWLGEPEGNLTIPAGTTVQALIRRLEDAHPKAAPLLRISRVAVNYEFVSPETILEDAQELAVIPPVSGGC